MIIYLIEIVGLTDSGELTTRYFSTGSGYVTRPDEDPANQVYEPRVISPGTYARHLWQPSTSASGAGSVTVGVIELANSDGALDGWLDWDFGGRSVLVLRGEDTALKSTFMVILTGIIASIGVSETIVQVNLRDDVTQVQNAPFPTPRYGGTNPGNSPPTGVDGTPDDIKGKFRPEFFGAVQNATPTRVNASLLVYEVRWRGIAELTNVFEGGNVISQGTLQPDTATLLATAPTAGTYDWTLGNDSEGAYFRLGSSPLLTITFSAKEGATDADRTIGQVAARILDQVGFGPALTDRLGTFDDKQPGVIGYWVSSSGATAGTVLSALCLSGGATWTIRRDGTFEILRLEAPVETPVATFSWYQMLSAPTVAPIDTATGGAPSYEVDLAYAPNFTVLTGSQVAGVVTSDRVDWLANASRNVTSKNTGVWDPVTKTGRNPLSQPLTVTTYLQDETDAQVEADRLATLYRERRRYVTISVPTSVAGDVDLGEVVTLTMPRFGNDEGVLHRVVGMSEDHVSETVELFCWR